MNAAISPGVSGVRTESLKGAGASAWGPAGTAVPVGVDTAPLSELQSNCANLNPIKMKWGFHAWDGLHVWSAGVQLYLGLHGIF